MYLGPQEAVAQAPAVEAEYRCEAQPAQAVLSLQADLVLRGICESDLRLILPAPGELVEVSVASVTSMFRLARSCCPSSMLLIAAETTLRHQSAERKEDYRD